MTSQLVILLNNMASLLVFLLNTVENLLEQANTDTYEVTDENMWNFENTYIVALKMVDGNLNVVGENGQYYDVCVLDADEYFQVVDELIERLDK